MGLWSGLSNIIWAWSEQIECTGGQFITTPLPPYPSFHLQPPPLYIRFPHAVPVQFSHILFSFLPAPPLPSSTLNIENQRVLQNRSFLLFIISREASFCLLDCHFCIGGQANFFLSPQIANSQILWLNPLSQIRKFLGVPVRKSQIANPQIFIIIPQI